MVKKIGLTGGIGSGKTTVSEVFNHLGVPVYNSDNQARQLMEQDPQLRKELIKLFGAETYHNNHLNRTKIAEIVFSNKQMLDKLNQLVHPFVREDFKQWVTTYHTGEYVIQEAAILFESGGSKLLDQVIVVDAPIDIRINRVMKRDGLNEDSVRKRINNQMPADKINQLADYVIVNDNKQLILPQIINIDRNIKNSY